MFRCTRSQISSMKRFMSLSRIPTMGALPLVGSTHLLFRAHKTRDGREFVPYKSFMDFLPLMYDAHGTIYTMGMPGIGKGIKGLLVVCCDPREYVEVLHNEGRNPYGIIMTEWPSKAAFAKLNSPIKGLFTQGEEWRRLRMAFQKALLTPDSVKGYVPGISKAAALASENFDKYQDRLHIFNMYSSYDMLFTSMFGRQMNSLREGSNDSIAEFIDYAVRLVRELIDLVMSPWETTMYAFGITTSRMKSFVELFRNQNDMSGKILEDFLARRASGELDEYELGSYCSVNLSRQEEVEDGLTLEEFKELVPLFLIAGVDTTAGTLTWVLLFLAVYPEVQAKVRQEVLSCVTADGSSQDLVEALSRPKKMLPYLNMVLREVHRIRPAIPVPIIKTVETEIELEGYNIPAETVCWLDVYSIQNDPKLVEDTEKFIPERWSPEAVEARKNTASEVIDHPLLRGSFSAGARMCPGHRVAQLEVITLAATLVRKWEFTIAPGQGINSYKDIKYVQGATVRPEPMPKLLIRNLDGPDK